MKNNIDTSLVVSITGISEQEAISILVNFKEIAEGITDADKSYGEYSDVSLIDKYACVDARSLRLKYKKIRTGCDNIHKSVKRDLLKSTQAIDFVRKTFRENIEKKEEYLLSVENHFENIEMERIKKLNKDRADIAAKFGVKDPELIRFGEMSKSVWDSYIFGAKSNHEALLEEERVKEEERIKKQNAEKIAREKAEEEACKLKIQLENQAINAKKLADIEKDRNLKIQKDIQDKALKEQKAALKIQEELRREARVKEAAAAKLQAVIDDKLKKEKESEDAVIAKADSDKKRLQIDKVKDFLKRNYASKESLSSGEYILRQSSECYSLYKKIDFIKI